MSSEIFCPSPMAALEANTETALTQGSLLGALDPLHGLFDALQQFLAKNNVMLIQDFTIDMSSTNNGDGCAGNSILTLNAEVLSLRGTGPTDNPSPTTSDLVLDASDAIAASSEAALNQCFPNVSMPFCGSDGASLDFSSSFPEPSESQSALPMPAAVLTPGSALSHCDDPACMPQTAPIQVIRADYLTYLSIELPRWTRSGLWSVEPNPRRRFFASPTNNDQLHGLAQAYSTVCMLDARIGDDTICKRRAQIELHQEYTRALRMSNDSKTTRAMRRVGRGGATPIIDRILSTAHRNWASLHEAQKRTLRGRFHNSKRYGKRWMLLAERLGRGILLLCSPKLAKMVCNSKFTLQLLDTVATQAYGCDTTRFVLDSVCEMADVLCSGGVVTQADTEHLLAKLRTV